MRPEDQARPKTAKISEEQAKQLFMASPHLEWSPWAKSMGWPQNKVLYDGFRDWSQEKKELIARSQAESISEALFSHQGRWHNDVMRTLKEYPEAADAMMGILKRRVNDIIATINDDDRKKQQHAAAGTLEEFRPKFAQIDNTELGRLASAIRITTDTKHRSLMIDRWSIKATEAYTDPKQFEAPQLEEQGWSVVLYNDEKMQADDLKTMMQSYYNQPSGVTIDVTADEDALETT